MPCKQDSMQTSSIRVERQVRVQKIKHGSMAKAPSVMSRQSNLSKEFDALRRSHLVKPRQEAKQAPENELPTETAVGVK